MGSMPHNPVHLMARNDYYNATDIADIFYRGFVYDMWSMDNEELEPVKVLMKDVVTMQGGFTPHNVKYMRSLPAEKFRSLILKPKYRERSKLIWCKHIQKWMLFDGHHRYQAAYRKGWKWFHGVTPTKDDNGEYICKKVNNLAVRHLLSAKDYAKILDARREQIVNEVLEEIFNEKELA